MRKSFIPRAVIPGYEIVESGNPCFQVFLNECSVRNRFKLNLSKRCAEINITHEEIIPDYQFTYFLLFLFQKLYQENDLYYLHGSSVSRAKTGTLLLGGEDYGKSRVALKLCLSDNFSINGDESLVFDNKTGRVIAGSSLMQMSKEKIAYFFPNQDIPIMKINRERLKDILDTKEIGIYSKVSEPITKVFYVHVMPHVPRFVEMKPFDAQLRLYQDMSKDIRGVGYIFINLDQPLPSLDTKILAKKRAKVIRNLMETGVRVYNLRGSLEDICKTISEVHG